MAVHLVALVAVHLSRGGGGGGATHLVNSLVWPYLVRLCLSLRVAHQDVVTSSRLFLFQLAQIINANLDHHSPTSQMANSNSRWDRALRLVRQRVALVRESATSSVPFSQHHEDSLRILSALAL